MDGSGPEQLRAAGADEIVALSGVDVEEQATEAVWAGEDATEFLAKNE